MKRIVQFLICILLLLVFSACKNKKETEKNVTQTNATQNIENEDEDEDEDEKKVINNDFLDKFLGSDFYPRNIHPDEISYNIEPFIMEFYQNGTYHFRPTIGGDPPYVKGNFQIINNKVLLKYISIPYYENPQHPQYYKFEDILKEDWELEYTTINDSLYYSEGLIGKGIVFGREKSRPKAGSIIKTNEFDIVIVEGDWLRLKSDVIVRIGPGSNYQHCTFEFYDHGNDDDEITGTSITEYCRKEQTIILIGRSINTDTIDYLTGYWYYCWIPVYPDTGGKIIKPKMLNVNNGWIFEPLKFSEKN